jgi:ribonuclease BN (tRNA processing enzyme)
VIDIYSWREPEEAREIVGRLSSEPLFPAPFATTPAKRSFHKIGEGGVDIGGVHVTFCPLNHPQGAAAYRFEERGKSIVFATDTEHPPEGLDKRLEEFARHASVFIYDAMYLPEEYEAGRQGWGHSTWLHGARLAKAACAGSLYLSHFNPDHGDRVIRRMRKSARAEFGPSQAAREGLKIKL